jgi:hypothetical protein
MMEVVVHKFHMSDVEDPDLWAAESLCNWEKSEAGEFVMKNAEEVPVWHRTVNVECYGYEYIIRAKLSPKNYTFWKLKYG